MQRFLFIIIVLLTQLSICFANNIPLSDKISNDNFISAFNNSYDAQKEGIRITAKTPETNDSSSPDRFLSGYVVNNGTTILLSYDRHNGSIYYVFVILKKPADESFEKVQPILMTTLLVERTFGRPNGMLQETGLFAIADALKKGKGTYWCDETNRKYIITPLATDTVIMLEIKASF